MSRLTGVLVAAAIAVPFTPAPSSACEAGIRPSLPPQPYADLSDCDDCEIGLRPSLPPQPYVRCP